MQTLIKIEQLAWSTQNSAQSIIEELLTHVPIGETHYIKQLKND